MKKINPKLQFLHLAAALAFVLILFLSTTTTTTTLAVAEEGGYNATRIANCLAEDEEFLMESETTRRILVDAGKTITSPKPYCNRHVYSSCGPRLLKFYKKRKCDYKNSCDRKGQ